ncbi:MAG: FecR family protein [Marinifilaceae bacterium]
MERDSNEILAKSITGKTLNEEERQLWEAWLKESGNKRFFHKLEEFHSHAKEVESTSQMNVEQAYQKHLMRVKNAQAKKRTLLLHTMMRYAAILLIVVSVSAVMFYVSRHTEVIHPEEQWLAEVAPGSQKAELVLANGEVMNLEEKEEQIETNDGTQIRNTGKSLIYGAGQKSKLTAPSYNSLVVPRGGEYQLVLEDGTKVWINSESRLRYPTRFAANQRTVLLEGEAYFEVSKDKARPFIVKTQGVDVRVLGTSFNVSSYYEKEQILTTLVEGSVEIIDRKQDESRMMLEPGYQAQYSKGNGELRKEKVNVELYTSWKEGRFVFENTSLEQLMDQVARWYDVKVFYLNNEAKEIRFTGGLKRYDNLERLLTMIEKTNDVRFVINGKAIGVEKIYSWKE